MKVTKVYPILSLEDFLEKVTKVESFTSIRGKRYKVKNINQNIMSFVRLDANPAFDWDLDLYEVYKAYVELDEFYTTQFKNYVPRKHSPAMGILLHLGMIK